MCDEAHLTGLTWPAAAHHVACCDPGAVAKLATRIGHLNLALACSEPACNALVKLCCWGLCIVCFGVVIDDSAEGVQASESLPVQRGAGPHKVRRKIAVLT